MKKFIINISEIVLWSVVVLFILLYGKYGCIAYFIVAVFGATMASMTKMYISLYQKISDLETKTMIIIFKKES